MRSRQPASEWSGAGASRRAFGGVLSWRGAQQQREDLLPSPQLERLDDRGRRQLDGLIRVVHVNDEAGEGVAVVVAERVRRVVEDVGGVVEHVGRLALAGRRGALGAVRGVVGEAALGARRRQTHPRRARRDQKVPDPRRSVALGLSA